MQGLPGLHGICTVSMRSWRAPLLHDLGFTGLHALHGRLPGDDGKSYAISHERPGRCPSTS